MSFVREYAETQQNVAVDEVGFKTEVASILRFHRDRESVFPTVNRIFLPLTVSGIRFYPLPQCLLNLCCWQKGRKKTLTQILATKSSEDGAMNAANVKPNGKNI